MGLHCHRRMRGGAKVGSMSKSEVVVSRKELPSAEKNYPVHEKEMLALVDTL